jgi:hypothetical protein
MALSRAGKARRSGPFTASETLVSSRAWGWLRFFAASPRARPAARTSPPSGAGVRGGGARRASHRHRHRSTPNDLNPVMPNVSGVIKKDFPTPWLNEPHAVPFQPFLNVPGLLFGLPDGAALQFPRNAVGACYPPIGIRVLSGVKGDQRRAVPRRVPPARESRAGRQRDPGAPAAAVVGRNRSLAQVCPLIVADQQER